MTYYHNGDDRITNSDIEQDDRFDDDKTLTTLGRPSRTAFAQNITVRPPTMSTKFSTRPIQSWS
jgi:hypothetical protein